MTKTFNVMVEISLSHKFLIQVEAESEDEAEDLAEGFMAENSEEEMLRDMLPATTGELDVDSVMIIECVEGEDIDNYEVLVLEKEEE